MAVRRESVIIDGTDNLTPILLREVAAAKLLNRELRNLSGININVRGLANVERDIVKTSRALDQGGNALDSFSGRAGLLVQGLAAIGPAMIPVGALAGPALAGLTTGLAGAALGGASLIAALQGVGDATKAVDAYNLDPTVESYEAAREALEALSPAAQQFVSDFQEFQPVLTSLRDASAEGWMPGLSASLDNLTELAPRARDLLLDVSRAGGEALADSTASLASDRWSDFYDLIDRQAPEAITTLTNVVGNLTHGLAEMMVSAEPGSNGFMGWVDEVADGFDRWATSDQGREDVQVFLDYAATNGPKVQALFGSLVDTVAQVVQAAAPLGGPVLTTLTAVSDIIGNIADSDAGTPLLLAAAGMSAFSRAAKITNGLAGSAFISKRFPDGIRAAGAEARAGAPRFRDFGNALVFAAHSNDTLAKAQANGSKASSASAANAIRARQAVLGWSKGAATAAVPIAALGLTATGAAEGMGISNTAAGALIGTLGGPWGMAIGAAAGGVLDLSSALTGNLTSALEQAQAAAGSGNLPQMRAELGDLRSEIDNTSAAGGFFSDAMHGLTFGKIDGITAARDEVALLDDAIRKAQETSVRGFGTEGNGLNLLAQGLDLTAEQFDRARLAGSNFFDMVGSAGKVLDRRGQWRAYQAAIDNASAALEQNGRTLNNNTAAGRANNDALDQIGASALTFAQNLKGADRVDYLRNARNGIQQAAVDFGLGQAAARRLANEIIGVGNIKPAKPKVGLDINPWKKGKQGVDRGMGEMDGSSANPWVDLYDGPFQQTMGKTKGAIRALNAARANPVVNLNDQATGRAQGIQAVIDNITGKTVYITTVHRDVRVAAPQGVAANPTLNADGGYISGPGGPRDDLIPAMLSNGEFVINAAATARNLSLLHEINAQRYADGGHVSEIKHFASGGRVSGGGKAGGDVFEIAFGKHSKALGGNLRRLEKALDRNKSALDKLTEKRDTYSSAVTGNFRSNPFATDNDPWSGAGNDPLAILKADIGNAQQFNQLRASFGNRIKGDALAEVDTLEEARQLAAYSPDQQRDYQRAFVQRQSITASIGRQAATAAYGTTTRLEEKVERVERAIKQLEKSNKKNSDDNADRTARGTGRQINGAASNGRKRRSFTAAL